MTNNSPGFDFLWKLAAFWLAGAVCAVIVAVICLSMDAAERGRTEALSHSTPTVTTPKP